MEKLKQGLKWFFNSYIWLGILLLIIDIVTKNIIVNYGQEIQSANQYATHGSTYNNGGINLIPGFLGINYLINENIAFGLMIGNKQLTQILFSIVAMIVVIGIVIYLIKKWDKSLNLLSNLGHTGSCGVIDTLFNTLNSNYRNIVVLAYLPH